MLQEQQEQDQLDLQVQPEHPVWEPQVPQVLKVFQAIRAAQQVPLDLPEPQVHKEYQGLLPVKVPRAPLV